MIKTVAELLHDFMQIEERKLGEHNITHCPTIGGMYEQLTRTILDKALPTNPPLSVVSGFAQGSDGKLSFELDAMLVYGEGQQLPYSDKWIYPIEQVLAVIEIKKSLYQAQISEGFDNLQSVINLRMEKSENIRHSVENAFHLITKLPAPEDPAVLSPFLQQVCIFLLFTEPGR